MLLALFWSVTVTLTRPRMPRKYPAPPLREVEPGIRVTRNTCIIDASKKDPDNNPPLDHNPKGEETAPEDPKRQIDAEGRPAGDA